MSAGVVRFAVALVVAGLPVVASAQVIPPSEQPGRERERFTVPTPPQARPGGPAITLPSTVAPVGAEKITVNVREVRIVGATVYSAEQLRPLYQDLIGHKVPLPAIYDLARRITAKYGNDGYVLSRAVVPAQQLNPKGAIVRIEVIEGYIDKVEWPASLARYRDFFSDYARKMTATRPANIRTIERYLLLAGDLPGLKLGSRLKPSATNNDASTLVVDVVEKPIDANARVDNRGTKARGPIEYFGSAAINNLFKLHEALTISYATVNLPRELQYVAVNYRQVLTSEGLTWFVNGSDSWGRPGTVALATLQYRTVGPYADTGFSYPVIRSRERNVTLTGLAFGSDNRSNVRGERFTDDRIRGVRAKADADIADSLNGVNQFNLTVSHGIHGLGSTDNGNPLASRLVGRVDFSKLEGSASRMQPLFGTFSAYVSGYGQYALTPLLTPEQCGYGGRFFGRAFDPSQLLGDSCVEALGELRYDVPLAQPGQVQLYGFADYGKLFVRQAAAGTPTSSEAASAGGGLRLGWPQYVNLDLQMAKGIEGPRRDLRTFFVLTGKY
jgi:hemolysin activation/secretion protein